MKGEHSIEFSSLGLPKSIAGWKDLEGHPQKTLWSEQASLFQDVFVGTAEEREDM